MPAIRLRRVLLAFALTCAWSSISSRPRAAGTPDKLLATCRPVATEPDQRKLVCRDFTVRITVEQPAFSVNALVDGIVQPLVRKDPKLSAEKITLVVGGAERVGVRIVDRGKPPSVALGAWLPASAPDKVRMVLCEESRASLCPRVLEEMVAEVAGMPRAPATASGPDEAGFAGRPLALAEGCRFTSEGPKSMVNCGGAVLSWFVLDADFTPEQVIDAMKGALAAQGKVSERRGPCMLDGKAASCRTLSTVPADGKPWEAVMGSVIAGGKRYVLQCNKNSGTDDQMPPPCSLLMQWKK